MTATAKVLDLTPELVEQFAQAKLPRYFVKLDAPTCHHPHGERTCQVMDVFWTQLSNARPHNNVWTKLDCLTYPQLCSDLVTSQFVTQLGVKQKVALLTVSYSPEHPQSNHRVVEFHRGSNAEEAARYFLEMTDRPLPLEPLLPHEIEKRVVDSNDNNGSLERTSVPLAILVLTMDGFTSPEVWKAFQDTAQPDSIRIFVHSKNPVDSSSSVSSSSKSTSLIPGVISVPTVHTDRLSISLVRAVLQMLRYAVAYGGATQYVVVSGDSVPLRSAPEMIAELLSYNETRFSKHLQEAFQQDESALRRPYDGVQSFLMRKNWVCLNDVAAQFFAAVSHDETSNFEMMTVADEYYWANVAQEYEIPFVDKPFMYDEWPVHMQAERPNLLTSVDSTKMGSGGHLFARKITNETVLDLKWMMESNKDGSEGGEL